MRRTAWIVIAACALLAAPFAFAALLMMGSTAAGEGDIVSIRGLAASGNTVYPASSRRRLLKSAGLDRGGPEVTDSMLRAMVAAVLERAAKGEPEAVDFALELARAQREAAAAAAAAAPPPLAAAKKPAEKATAR
ncbi:MAG: hypothetical protein HY721_26200 [Planctomycetes bacterium]|nr:hypothetical protein [Planctomycetota bacterium]